MVTAPVNGVAFTTGSIFVVSNAGSSSDTCSQYPTRTSAVAGLRAWEAAVESDGELSHTDFQDAPLSSAEAGLLGSLCQSIQIAWPPPSGSAARITLWPNRSRFAMVASEIPDSR